MRAPTKRKWGKKLIRSVVERALKNRKVSPEATKKCHTTELFEGTSNFRCYVLFPGESMTLRYDFLKKSQRYMGYLGFDDQKTLISVDERAPKKQMFYRKGTSKHQIWVIVNP